MHKIYESYTEDNIVENMQQLDEFVGTAILTILATGLVLRVADGFMGNKPKMIHYLTALVQWATGEATSDGINPLEIRKFAYQNLTDEKEDDELYGRKSSKILSRRILGAAKKGSVALAKVLGSAIGSMAKRAGLSKSDLNKIIPA